MNKKIYVLLVFQLCLFTSSVVAQAITDPCFGNNVTCIQADTQHVKDSSYWYTSHGVLFSGDNYSVTSPSGTRSLSLYSMLGSGNGAFTSYRFMKDTIYRVCFWVRNHSGWPPNNWGKLYVKAAKGLNHNGNSGPGTIPSVTDQIIDQSYGPASGSIHPRSGASDWEFISVTFKANDDFTSIWFYAYNPMGPPPPGNPQWNNYYVVEVDDIRVMKEGPPYNIVSSATKDTIEGCNDATTLTLSGMPANTVATWTPSVTPQNSSGSVVVAKPCSTTVYRIEITDPSASCGNCVREVIYDTIVVRPWADTSHLVYPRTAVPCLGTLFLDYNDPGTCSHIGSGDYTWVDPNGVTYAGKTQTIPGVYSSLNGEWTLKIWNSAKGCHEELRFPISIGSCCVSNPNYSYTPFTNPMTFSNTGSGITIHTGTLWSFGDGKTSDDLNPVHTYNFIRDTTISVCLTMLYKDSQGNTCCNRICKPVFVKANSCAVITNFTYTPTAGGSNEFDFTDVSSGTGTLCQYDWEFYDGPVPSITTTFTPTVRFKFYTPGPWYVCLTTTNCWWDPVNRITVRCSTKKCMWVGASSTPPPPPHSSTGSTGIKGNQGASDGPALNVYENPNHGQFSLSLRNREGTFRVVVRDPSGKEIYSSDHWFGKDPVRISLEGVAPGIYTVEVANQTEKFVQQMSVLR